MATHYPTGEWFRLVVHCHSERSYQNEVWFLPTAPFSSTFDISAAAAAMDSLVTGVWPAFWPSTVTYDGIDIYANNGVYTVKGSTSGGTIGTASGDPLPSEICVIGTLNSGVGTRTGVGRIFVGPLAESMSTGSYASTTALTNMTALLAALMAVTSISTTACNLAVWSRKMNALEKVVFTENTNVLAHRKKRAPRR